MMLFVAGFAIQMDVDLHRADMLAVLGLRVRDERRDGRGDGSGERGPAAKSGRRPGQAHRARDDGRRWTRAARPFPTTIFPHP